MIKGLQIFQTLRRI